MIVNMTNIFLPPGKKNLAFNLLLFFSVFQGSNTILRHYKGNKIPCVNSCYDNDKTVLKITKY